MKIQGLKLRTLVVLTVLIFSVLSESNLNADTFLREPQKIVIDLDHDRLLVSNFGNGNIVEVFDDGSQDSIFIENAGFIDGLDIVDNVIYGVGFNRKFYGYDLDTKEKVLDFTFPDSNPSTNYLSSVTSDSSGHIFISCPALHAIYKYNISDTTYTVFAQGGNLIRPNGILLERENDRIVVINDSAIPSFINAISLSDSSITPLDTNSFRNPDGIVRDIYGDYYVGGYYLDGIFKIDKDFSFDPEMIFAHANMVYPTYDARDHSLLVTYYWDNSWERLMLDDLGVDNNSLNKEKKSKLIQNYPNPFNPETAISFYLEKNSNVTIKIFNINGEVVKNLLDSSYSQGDHKVLWDGKNNNSKNAASGHYFINLIVNDNEIYSKKILLLK